MHTVLTRIESIRGNVITIRAQNVHYLETAIVHTQYGNSLASVIKIMNDEVSLQVFMGGRGISTGDQVSFTKGYVTTSFSKNLLGRVFNGIGKPRDTGPSLDENLIDIRIPPVNPVTRIIPHNMIRTGIPMIDIFNTLVESQKIPVFSISGEPYNQLLARLALQAEVDIIILGGI